MKQNACENNTMLLLRRNAPWSSTILNMCKWPSISKHGLLNNHKALNKANPKANPKTSERERDPHFFSFINKCYAGR